MEFTDGNIDQIWGIFRSQPTKTGEIKNKGQSTCVDVPDGKMIPYDNTALRLWPCNSAVAQKITRHVLPGSSGENLTILGYCLYSGPANNSSTNTFVNMGNCGPDDGTNAFLWKVNSDGTITSVQGKKCLGADSQTDFGLQKCNGSNNQKWTTP
jgi:hypothetical protein